LPELPDLRIVPVADLLPHEHHDAQRSQPLTQRLTIDGVLRNPPIITPIDSERRFVVLDGANRVMAIQALGLPHIIAQVVDYDEPDLILDTWYHLVVGFPRQAFDQALKAEVGPCLEPVEIMQARARLARREALATIVSPEAGVFTICAEGDVQQRTTRLNNIVNIYRTRGRIFRVNTDHLENLRPYYDDVTVLVVFPHYEPAEILDLARVGALLPAGITRHIIPCRALHVNFPLSVLREDRPVQDKNDWLKAWLKQRIARREARYYQESTFLFDE
jgi:hypothetical protein